ncbi:MAG: hypothetical protein ACE5KA_00030 [Nitrososphaerales archaeon]
MAGLFITTTIIVSLGLIIGSTVSAFAQPILVDPDRFKVELFADLDDFEGLPRAFQLTITGGENGFQKGLYVTSGPVGGIESDRLFHVDELGSVKVVKDGFDTIDTLVFAQDQYGDGMLITEPSKLRILRLLPDGTITTFAELGTEPRGPAILTYHEGVLYVTDASGGSILIVNPDGSSEIFASIPLSGLARIEGANAILFDETGRYGSGFITSTFTGDEEPTNVGAIYLVSADGKNVEELLGGLNGMEFLTFGPGGAFGSDLFVASQGTDVIGNGVVYTMLPDGTLTPFLKGLDAVHVVFDTEGILGGGMFVSDFPNGPRGGPHPTGKIWRVLPVDSLPTDMIRVDFEGNSFDVPASLSNGSVMSIDVDQDFVSIIIAVETSATEVGELMITLPRELIDSKFKGDDDDFIVLVDGEEMDYTEDSTTDTERALTIPVFAVTEEVEIIGTQVIPEFPITVMAVMGLVVAMTIGLGRLKHHSL